jgi:predicted ATPase
MADMLREERDIPNEPVAITFATFRLDLIGSRLLRGAAAVPLRPKTWAVLHYLAERAGALVTAQELFDALWPATAVTPDTLNKSIGELRAALGDDFRKPRFIETVHGRGFRFIADTQVGTGAPARQVGSADVETRPQPRKHPFVGRDEELQLLAQRFALAQAGERQIVFLTGPGGVGKTAMVEAFLDSPALRQTVAPVWIGRAGCFEHHGPREAYLPVLDALQRLARAPHVERLVRLMRRAAPMWLAQMPWLVDDADAIALRQSLQGVRAERMPRELALLIEALTADLTLVLVLEDLHWCDPSTVDLLVMLGQRHEAARLLVICTYRPAEVAVHEHVLASAVRSLQAQRQCAELPLHDLGETAVGSYLAARFPGADFPAALAHRIHAHTGGHPLFVVALVDHLVSRGWILDTAPGWALSAPLETIDLGVPDDVRHVIEAQLHRLSPAERAVLEAASVAGYEIAAPVLAAALDHDVVVTERHCEALARTQQFLQVAGKIEWPGGRVSRRYAFAHELYRQVVYEEIAAERCGRLHQRVGEALEAAYGARAVELAPQLAAHFERSHDSRRALRYLAAAGTPPAPWRNRRRQLQPGRELRAGTRLLRR